MDIYFDRAYGNWQPVEPIEIIGGKCAFCGENLIVGEEYVRNKDDGGIFCNNECFLSEYAEKFILDYPEVIEKDPDEYREERDDD